jgi:hypothetical protein
MGPRSFDEKCCGTCENCIIAREIEERVFFGPRVNCTGNPKGCTKNQNDFHMTGEGWGMACSDYQRWSAIDVRIQKDEMKKQQQAMEQERRKLEEENQRTRDELAEQQAQIKSHHYDDSFDSLSCITPSVDSTYSPKPSPISNPISSQSTATAKPAESIPSKPQPLPVKGLVILGVVLSVLSVLDLALNISVLVLTKILESRADPTTKDGADDLAAWQRDEILYIIFIIVGVVLLLGAIASFIVSKKNQRKNEKQG